MGSWNTHACTHTYNTQVTVAVAGATGYIGKAVVRECVRRGFKTKAYVREESMERAKTLEYLKGAEVREIMVVYIYICGGVVD